MKTKPISERALQARINRRLAKNDQKLLRCKESSRWYHDLGTYYLVDLAYNAILDKHVDLEALGRELKVLGSDEALVDETLAEAA